MPGYRRSKRHCLGLCTIANLTLLLVFFVGTRLAEAQEPMTSRIAHADKEPQNWLTYYGNYGAWSYSPLNQVNRDTVKQLVPVWAVAAGFPTHPSLIGGLEAAPLVVDGVLYLVGMQNNVYAMDAATGRRLWNYIYHWPDHEILGNKGSRGLAFGEGFVYMGTQDDHMVALDAKTGREVWNVVVDDNLKCKCSITSPPLYVKGKVITGMAGGSGGGRGHIQAVDAKTGNLVWRFDTVPAPGEPGSETWAGDSWKNGGVSTWLQGSYDPDLNMVYWGTGDPYPNLKGETREGSNLYSSSLLAVDADTGKLKWYYQEIPHDLFDYDSSMEPVLLDASVGGQMRKLVLHSSKDGYAYLLERDTGKFVKAFPFAATVNWSKGLDAEGKPVEYYFRPGNKTDQITCPGTAGARNFNHSAYSPHTGWWYTSSAELCNHTTPPAEGAPASVRAGRMLNPDSPPFIAAFDPLTGKKQWTFITKYANQSSLLATAGDLIFGGDLDGEAFALDAKTGKKLWSFNTGSFIVAPPVSYSVNGRQFIAIASGGGSYMDSQVAPFWREMKGCTAQTGATLFVFALPEKSN